MLRKLHFACSKHLYQLNINSLENQFLKPSVQQSLLIATKDKARNLSTKSIQNITEEMASVETGKSLQQVEQALNNWLQPKILGEGWDNIGLLVGSGKYEKHEKAINSIILCNDLRLAVVDEAISKSADMIIAYHPPIFVGMKSISYGNWKERIIARCLAHDMSIYSPHTTLDSTVGGINDRVLNALKCGNNAASPVEAITPLKMVNSDTSGVNFTSSGESITKLYEDISSKKDSDVLFSFFDSNEESVTLSVIGNANLDYIHELASGLGITGSKISPDTDAPFGAGRIVKLNETVNLDDAVDLIKSHLGLPYVQLAYGGNPLINSAAVCVGSGSSLLKPIAGKVDLLITGEMSHHDILDCISAGSSVVLCNHCSSERHFLPDLANILKVVTGISNIFVSEEDASPLRLVL